MGHLTAGPFYHSIGKIGNTVGRKVKGKNTLSMIPHENHLPASEATKAVRSRMKLISSWLGHASEAIKIGFRGHGPRQSAMSTAVSVNISRALTGTYPELSIDYARIALSSGALSVASNARMEISGTEEIKIQWSPVLENMVGSLKDVAVVLLYGEGDYNKYKVLLNFASREMGQGLVRTSPKWSGCTVHGYLFFAAPQGKLVSDTVYLGRLVLPESTA